MSKAIDNNCPLVRDCGILVDSGYWKCVIDENEEIPGVTDETFVKEVKTQSELETEEKLRYLSQPQLF